MCHGEQTRTTAVLSFSLFIYYEKERENTSRRGEKGRERETESASKGRAEREGERIPSRLHAVSTEPNMGLDPTNCEIMT